MLIINRSVYEALEDDNEGIRLVRNISDSYINKELQNEYELDEFILLNPEVKPFFDRIRKPETTYEMFLKELKFTNAAQKYIQTNIELLDEPTVKRRKDCKEFLEVIESKN